MKCTNCGNELADNAKFCPECGEKVVRECICQNCGTKLAPNTKFCPECGTKVEEMPLPKAEEPAPKQVEITDDTPREELLAAAEAGNSDAMARLAVISMKEWNFDEVYEWSLKAAEKDNAKGQCYLGDCYENGWGCDKDIDVAKDWYKKAAGQGNANAMASLSSICLDEENYDEVYEWALKAAEKDNAEGQRNLGRCYAGGWGCDRSFSEAKKWYKKAAEQGDSVAMVFLGILYWEKENYNEAFGWYKKAAEKSDSEGQNMLGFCYANGLGCKENVGEAKRWYKKAADQGDSDAMNVLGNLYYSEENYSEAFDWFVKAAEKDDVKGQYNLGFCYYNGVGVLRNEAKGLELIQTAAEAGDEDAIEELNNIQKGIKRKETMKKIGGGLLDFAKGFGIGILNELANSSDEDWDDE